MWQGWVFGREGVLYRQGEARGGNDTEDWKKQVSASQLPGRDGWDIPQTRLLAGMAPTPTPS